jgi:hypothetical protein
MRREWEDEDEDDRPRRRRAPRGAIRERLGAPSIFLMVVACLQACAHALLFVLMLAGVVMDGANADPPPEAALLICGVCLLGFLKDFLVIRGAVAMRQGRGYRWAMTGAIVACLPDAGCLFGAIAGIWSLTGLNDRRVRRAFDSADRGHDEDDEDDEDDF